MIDLSTVMGLACAGSLLAMVAVGAAAAGTASDVTKAANAALLDQLPFENEQDFEFAARGFIATRSDPQIRAADGRVVFDLSRYDFLKDDPPATANPSLWRQARLLTRHGLYKVTDHIYQVRAFDVSTITFIEGDTGYIVLDPLLTAEVAAAAYNLIKEHVGDKPVVAVVYSHSHADHFGGVRGVISDEDVRLGKVRVIAPEGFLAHAVSENIIAGNAMSRRARYQFGLLEGSSATGELTSGLGPALSRGAITLIAPTDIIKTTGTTMTIDGVTMEFQITPGTEAPAEMNAYFPQFRSVFMAENANATLHNILTLRGALVRNTKAWADYLTESIRLYADKSDTMFAAHGIPRFGQAEITDFLKKHRDAYKFLHDQSVRMMNQGLTGIEIAEAFTLPKALADQWFDRGYYGSYSHNAKAVYQFYMGWYDGNPASLHPHPPETTAPRYVEAMGGASSVITRAKTAYEAGDYRWASELLNKVVFAAPENTEAKSLLADTYEQLAYQAESGVWRNVYLTGARELRDGVFVAPAVTLSLDMIRATPTSMLLDFLAVRLNPDRGKDKTFAIDLTLKDFNERHLLTFENGVLIHEENVSAPEADVHLTMNRADFLQVALAGVPRLVKTSDGSITFEGDIGALDTFLGLIDPLDANFPIVTP